MNPSKLNIVFAGTPDFAAIALAAILAKGHHISAVYCQPDRPSGRGKKLMAGPVKQLALEHGIPVEQPLNFKSPESVEQLNQYQPDVMIVVAYGLLLPTSVLTIPKYGCINIHGSLLPRWRGAAPIQRAIQAGDDETGITIMRMDEGLDTGNMLLKRTCKITAHDTGSSLHDKLAKLGGEAIIEFLERFDASNEGEVQEDSLAVYAHKLSKQEAQIDWSSPASDILYAVRAFNAWPVCYTYASGKRLRIWQAELTTQKSDRVAGSVLAAEKSGISVACGDGQVIILTQLQPDGSKIMSAAALLNSRSEWFQNTRLGQSE